MKLKSPQSRLRTTKDNLNRLPHANFGLEGVQSLDNTKRLMFLELRAKLGTDLRKNLNLRKISSISFLSSSVIFFFAFFVNPIYGSESPCARALLGMDLNQQFKELQRLNQSRTTSRTVALTQLLNKAVSPLLKDIHDLVLSTTPEEILSLKNELENEKKIDSFHTQIDENAMRNGLYLGFDGSFVASYTDSIWNHQAMGYSYTNFNNKTMESLFLAVKLMTKIIDQEVNLSKDPTLTEVPELLRKHTYTKLNLERMLYYGFLSVLQGASQLTAEPVGLFSSNQMLSEVMKASEKNGPSPLTLYSLLLSPGLIAHSAPTVYIKEALTISPTGSLVLSDKICDFLKSKRRDWMTKVRPFEKGENEFGHGCPVAHPLAKSER